MTHTKLRIPPELVIPQERETFFRHLLQDESEPVELRVGVLQALTDFIEQQAYERARRAGELWQDGQDPKASEAPVMYRSVRGAWEELQRDGRLPAGRRGTASLLEDEQLMAMFVAIVVRDALETFHAGHIPDALMKEFNTLVRNAIYTALRATRSMVNSEPAVAWVVSQLIHIPPYWEKPVLLTARSGSTHAAGE